MKDLHGMDESNYSIVYDKIDLEARHELRDYPANNGITFRRELESDPSDPTIHYRLAWAVYRLRPK